MFFFSFMFAKWLPQFQTAYLYLKQKEVGRSTMFILTKSFLEHFSQLWLLSHWPKFCNVVLPSYEGTRKVPFHSVESDSLRPHELQHARLPCPSPTPGDYANSRPLSRWGHPAISSAGVPFSSAFSLSASGFFPMSQFFTSGGQSIGVSASASVLPMNI